MNRRLGYLFFALFALLAEPCFAQAPRAKQSFMSRFKGKSKKQRQIEKLMKKPSAFIDGQVTNESTLETLYEAYVLLPSKGAITTSDKTGYFQLKAHAYDAQVKTIHPDVFDTYYNIVIHDELYTPVGAVRLKPIMIGEFLQANASYREQFSSKILANSPYSAIDILKQSGTFDFNELIARHASVDKFEAGGEWGASSLSIRGFGSKLTQVNFNGISINNAETGSSASPFYAGIGSWVRKAAITRGAASSATSAIQPAGLLHIDGFMPRQKAGVDAQFNYGSGNYMQAALGLHSGTTKAKNFAVSLKIDGASSEGITAHSGFETLGAYFTLFAKSYQRHQINFTTAFRYWSKELNSSPLYQSQAEEFGYNHNNSWDKTNNNGYFAWNTSEGYSALSSLNHEWKISKEGKLISQFYARFEEISLGDTILDFSLLQENSQSTQLGFQSRYLHTIDNHAEWWIATDFSYYAGDKSGNSDHLLAYVPFHTPADTFLFQQHHKILNFGLTAHFQKQWKRWRLLAEMAGYYKGMSLTAPLENATTSNYNSLGYRLLGGGSFRLAKNHSLKGQVSASSNPQEFAAVFPCYSSWKNDSLSNRQITGAELAYAYQKKGVGIELRAFSYQLRGLSLVMDQKLNGEINQLAFFHDINQKHQAIELNAHFMYRQKHQLLISASFNNFIYTTNTEATYYNTDFRFQQEKTLQTQQAHSQDSSPFNIYAENTFMLSRELSFCINYKHHFGVYSSPFNPQGLQQQLADGYGLLGAEISYYKDLARPGSRLHLFANCQNMLNAIYTNQIWRKDIYPSSADASYTIYDTIYSGESANILGQFGIGRNWSVGIRYVF